MDFTLKSELKVEKVEKLRKNDNLENVIMFEQFLDAWLLSLRSDYDQMIFCLYTLGWTQEEIAKVCDCTRQNIQYKIKTYQQAYNKNLSNNFLTQD